MWLHVAAWVAMICSWWMLVRPSIKLGLVAGEVGVVLQSQWAKLWLSDRLPTATAAQDIAAGWRPRSVWRGSRPFTVKWSHTLNSPAQAEEFPSRSEIWIHSSRNIFLINHLLYIVMEQGRNYGYYIVYFTLKKDRNLHKSAIKRQCKSYNHRDTIGFAIKMEFSLICSCEISG